MKTPPAFLALSLLGLVAPDATASDRPNLDAWQAARPAPVAATAAPVVGHVAARDPARGVPSLFWAPADGPAPTTFASAHQAARWHLDRNRAIYQAPRAAIAGARHLFTHDTGRGGVIVGLRQTVGGVDVFHGDVKVLLDRSQRLVGISGSLHPAATPDGAQPFALAREAAVAAALRDLYGATAATARLTARGTRAGWQRFDLAGAAIRFDAPARLKPVYFPVGQRLAPAYLIELQSSTGATSDVFQYVVAADDGRLLHRNDATAYEAFQYRVWVDGTKEQRPLDGPLTDFTPHPTGVPGQAPNTFTTPGLVEMEGFNTNPNGEPDPWLVPGATESRGNNVDAYVDHDNNNKISPNEFRASVTSPGVFDRTFDVKAEPLASVDQSKAAITQLFYVVNWMHDWWYDSGFDEAAGNAQLDNFGRGGEAGDHLLAEAQDAALVGSRNNANMSTPLDGGSPRMQMYLWTSPFKQGTLHLVEQNKDYTVGMAGFGPKNYDLTAGVAAMVDNGGPSTTDGCTAAINNIAGKIALVDRGNCTFETKSANAQAGGAVGVLIANNIDSGTVLAPGVDNNVPDPTIPTQGLFKPDGAAIRAALMNGPVTAHITGVTGVERDGTIDNTIIAHEWGHYMHMRLVECGTNQCRAQSEGWGDFMAMHLQLRDGDDLDGVYALAQYATSESTGYYGIRRAPYSVDTTKNALSFRHISDGVALPNNHPILPGGVNSEVHNSGEVWTTMMWEAYIALHKAHAGKQTFDEVRRLMSDYVVAGMMLAPSGPTYTEQRDAILLAIRASSVEDMQTVAAAFAKRGAGTCAVSPERTSTDFKGVKESFTLAASALLTSLKISDDLVSCDHDGVVDGDETGSIRVNVFSNGVLELPAGSTVEVISPDPALVFPDGPSVMLPALEPLTNHEVVIPVEIDKTLDTYKPLTVTVRLTTPEGCQEFTELSLPIVVHGDVVPESSTSDDAETMPLDWKPGGEDGVTVWSRKPMGNGYTLHGDDVPRASDTWLQSPPMVVSKDAPLVIAFDHAYSFEYSQNTYWDGAVIELSSDGGMTWTDVATLGTNPGYGGKINSMVNPMNGRQALVNTNPKYPALEPLTLDFGDAFAGAEVLLRFRIGTDGAAGAPGWDIDNVKVTGIDNTPFASWTVHQGLCNDGGTTDGGGTDGGTTDGGGTDGTTTLGGDTTTTGDTATTGDASVTGGSATVTATATDGSSASASGGSSASAGSDGSSATASGSGSAGSAGSASGSDTDSDGQAVDDEGCGCATDGEGGLAWHAAPLLALLGLRRRRRA